MEASSEAAMSEEAELTAEACNCLAVRQAARHLTQFYDQCLAASGLRATQFSILARLKRRGAMTINALAREMVMDRTTLGRNILPLQREGLITAAAGRSDRRSKELRLTPAGAARFAAAGKSWARAQARFEAVFGSERSRAMRDLMRAVSASELGEA
jgi:DNA-binding MarR family transcriptional regulator